MRWEGYGWICILCARENKEDERRELEQLRRIHGSNWLDEEYELDTLRNIHDKWAHPARSDRGNYTEFPAYWNGDL